MRPLYETKSDLEKERETILEACGIWKCEAVKLPIKYSVDYMLMRGPNINAICEVRVREKLYDSYMLSLYKWKTGRELAGVLGKPFILLVKFPLKTVYLDLMTNLLVSFGYGGMSSPRDWQDQEPMVFIPMKDFKDLVNPTKNKT